MGAGRSASLFFPQLVDLHSITQKGIFTRTLRIVLHIGKKIAGGTAARFQKGMCICLKPA
jgi:hypothetical protein